MELVSIRFRVRVHTGTAFCFILVLKPINRSVRVEKMLPAPTYLYDQWYICINI